MAMQPISRCHWRTTTISGEDVMPHDVRLGGRGKITKRPDPSDKEPVPAVGRLILMLSHRDLLLLGNVESLLTRSYLSFEYPIAVGFKWCHGYATDFAMSLADHHHFMCFDAEKFDSSISDWMGRDAIAVLREQFIDGENSKYDAYWQFVENSLFGVTIQRDDGIRMQRQQGTTTGHSFNNLIQSVITLLIGYTCILMIVPSIEDVELFGEFLIYSLGDDQVPGRGERWKAVTPEAMIQHARTGFGINWGGKECFHTTRLVDGTVGDFQGVHFLGKYMRADKFQNGEESIDVITPYRPFYETLEKLYYPEYGAKGLDESYERALVNYIDGAGNPTTRAWLDGYLDWLEGKGAVPPAAWSGDLGSTLMKDYYNLGEEAPVPQRWTYAKWQEFTHVIPLEGRLAAAEEDDLWWDY